MSKAVTNEEVEDVLSSIRRLVSEDKRPLAGLRAAPAAAVAEPAQAGDHDSVDQAGRGDAQTAISGDDVVVEKAAVADRLVLTPALRVTKAAEPAEETTSDGPLDLGLVARQTWTPEQGDTQEVNEEATVEEAKAYKGPMMLFPAAQDSVADEEREAAMDALDALVHDALEAEEVPDDRAATSMIDDTALEDGDYSDEGYWDDDDDNAEPDYEQTGAVNEDALTAVVQDEPTEQEDSALSQSNADADGEDDLSNMNALDDEADDNASMDKVDEAQAGDDLAVKVASSSAVPLTLKIAALETAVSKITADWEPDGDERDALSASDTVAMAWEDDVELDAKGAPFIVRPSVSEDTAQMETAADDPAPDDVPEAKDDVPPIGAAFGADDQLMDEEALRDLVSEIVRAELQGALGERITRNVRKLVRREIHRALTAQEME